MSSGGNTTVARSFHGLHRWLQRAPILLMSLSLVPVPASCADPTMVVLPPRRQLPAAPKPAQPTGTTGHDTPDDGNLRGKVSGNLAAGL